MITAAIHGVTVSPQLRSAPDEGASKLGAIACEIAQRVGEMNDERCGAGTDLITRLASIARLDRASFATVIAVMHGYTSCLTDSYSARGEQAGRTKQTVHYRTAKEIAIVAGVFPEVGSVLSQIRSSVNHHQDPISTAQIIRDATE